MAYEEGDDDVADLGEHKSVIMSLLGQLKLGMDLTKVRAQANSISSFFSSFFLKRIFLLDKYFKKGTPEIFDIHACPYYVQATIGHWSLEYFAMIVKPAVLIPALSGGVADLYLRKEVAVRNLC